MIEEYERQQVEKFTLQFKTHFQLPNDQVQRRVLVESPSAGRADVPGARGDRGISPEAQL